MAQEADFDAIVVGAGCAGSVAAYELAKAGKSVLVIERGAAAGAKNMTGGRLYMHALRAVFGELADEAPLERRIAHERISMITAEGAFTADFSDAAMAQSGQDSYSVLRATFDPWLAEQAERAGAEFIYGIAVEALVKEGDRVCGVRAGDDEITANVVILADGVNSLLTEEAVGFKRPAPHTMAVGIKQVIELSEQTINDRLLCAEGEGAAWLFAGEATKGIPGGGFIYTNKKSVSVGMVATIGAMDAAGDTICGMLESFKAHPVVAPLLVGGKVVEHSGHMVPEGGLDMMPELTGEGVLLAGESAMMCVNLGYMVRGMDYAIAAGMHAGRSAAAALEAGDTSKAGLAGYTQALEQSFVLQDLRQFKLFPHFMESNLRIYNEYPTMIADIMRGMFLVDGTPVPRMRKAMMPHLKKVGLMTLLGDVRKGMKAL